MRRAIPIGLSLVVLSCGSTLALAAREDSTVHAQQAATATSTPAPFPTVTVAALPVAAGLLTGSSAALKTANTFHIVSRIRVALSGLIDGTVIGAGDVQLKPAATHLHVTGNLKVFGKGQKLNEHVIQIGKKGWTRDASTHHVWALNRSSSANSIVPANNNPLKVPKGDRTTDIVTVGAATVGTVLVWHLHGTYIAKVDSTHTAAGTIDYYIGQSDGLPYDVTVHVADTTLKILEDVDVASTNFAKRVVIRAPKVGSSSP